MSEASQTVQADTGAPAAILEIIKGFWLSRAVYVAAKLGIADLVRERPKTAAELAAATGTHAPSLHRVLRALTSAGVLTHDRTGRFGCTPVSAALLTSVPGSMRAFAITELGEEHYPAWGDVLYSVRTGQIAFNRVFGMSPWEFFAQNPENAKTFNEAMVGASTVLVEGVLASYDFSPIRKLVDVAGGHGGLIVSILKANPGMNGVLFDLAHVIEGAKPRIQAERLADRCELIAGDIFDSVPAGGDAYILKWIIHDWDDERSIAILKNCHRSMEKGGKLLLVESIIPPGNEPSFNKFMDLNMLVMTGGRERTETEYRALFEAVGFRLTKIVPTTTEMSVIEGVRA